ncbi:hypothetical protein DB30_03817 [Enhygromyxa salina]|uniref:Uncharacterized protein n=1 Tax=Enhygromyxa salina TaxID=215803 RepID=A0A0C2D822_9BACT|nr:FxLYD domain-containing protein [Enhygromyxa salina]KIG19261.1 hypothetical protein DB30_03817 [Enhygromyxa salina]
MSTEALVCPSCRAPGASGPNANDEYFCRYCETQFRRTPTPAAGPAVVNVNVNGPTQQKPATALVLGLVTVLLGVGLAGGVFLMGWRAKPSASNSASASASAPGARSKPVAVAVPASSEDPAEVAPRSSVVAPAPVAATPEPEILATASFDFHRIQTGYQTSFYALGVVTNTSPFPIDKPKVIAVLLDEAGTELTTDFGYAERDVLGPDESSPIKILVQDPPAHASVRYEVVPRKASYIPKLVEGLRVEPGTPRPAKYGDNRWELEGKVFNEGTLGAKFVEIEIQALDKDGKLVGVGSTFADGEVLTPGGSARYSNNFATAEAVDHFEFSVTGKIAD